MVTGVNANDQGILGDWSSEQLPENVVTILEGLQQVAPKTEFVFVDQGVYPNKMKQEKVNEAIRKARTADLNIVVVGEQGARYMRGRTCGENRDRANTTLLGLQEELVRGVAASGKPTIMVVVAGRPQSIVWAEENLPAILYAWEPGMYGGQAVAEILYGEVNPSAKMSMTIPRNSGQIGIYYNHKPSHYFHKTLDQNPYPLYNFGYGLSYTEFEYSDLALSAEKISADGTVDVEVTITNKGKRDGVEIAQLYIRDCYSSVTRPVKELKDFTRVELKAGESKRVKFTITPDKLQFYNVDMERVVEPGEFKVMVGSSSRDKDLHTVSFVVE
jgi:beta-glucosidase